MIELIRSNEDHLILLDCGGVFPTRGSELKMKAELSLSAMNLMDYTAMNPGGSEFFFGTDFLKKASSDIAFPLVTSNLVYKDSRLPFGKKCVIKNAGGLKVAILGIMPVGAFEKIPDPGSLKNLEIIPPKTALKNLLPEVREKADFVILLSEDGFEAATSLVNKLKGIDLAIFYGRKRMGPRPLDKGGTLVVHTGSRGSSLGFLQITVNVNGEIYSRPEKRIKLDESVAKDELIAKMIDDAFYKKAREKKRIGANRKQRKIQQEINKLMKMTPDEYIEMLRKKQTEGGDKR